MEDLLYLEGFSEIEYVKLAGIGSPDALADDRTDFGMWDAYSALPYLDRGKAFLVVAGIHAGCYQLFATGATRSIRDLKGKTIAVYELGQGAHVLVASMLAYVGMSPTRDVRWLSGERPEDAVRLFEEGKADAFIGFPPHPQELLAKKVGHVILDTSRDRPWSQYFCCMLLANRRFTESHPVATKRVLRAFLKAADICAQEPDRAARLLVDRGFEPRYEIAHDALTGVSYRHWREANPEDTLRFYGLRLHEVGMIRTNPNKLIARSTDWRFLNALKRELRA
ncbi:MAG: ABC transporter substrate-binding protein [Burkholderiales bacterium]|nr:ABC transporter substrate-binding protein [Burkholderiales bacterium]